MSFDHIVPGYEPTELYRGRAQNALVPGTQLAEFEIKRVLGEGGFSIVYLAEDRSLHRFVAIKEYLPAELAKRGNHLEVSVRRTSQAETFTQGLHSFINEARLLARFDNPSLVRVHHFWKAHGTAYMVMPYLEGATLLATRQAMARPPDEAWLRSLLGQVLGALELMHSASCYHRDIAPDNILILPDDRPVLLDFGAARRVIGERTQQLTAILKPAYAPIEQYADAADLQQGAWTDLYALAATVRYCICGTPPLPAPVRAVHDDLQPLAEETRALGASFTGLAYSPAFLAAIDWALALHPKDRPQTVRQFREALDKPYVSVAESQHGYPSTEDRAWPAAPACEAAPRHTSRAGRWHTLAPWALACALLGTLCALAWKWNETRATELSLAAIKLSLPAAPLEPSRGAIPGPKLSASDLAARISNPPEQTHAASATLVQPTPTSPPPTARVGVARTEEAPLPAIGSLRRNVSPAPKQQRYLRIPAAQMPRNVQRQVVASAPPGTQAQSEQRAFRFAFLRAAAEGALAEKANPLRNALNSQQCVHVQVGPKRDQIRCIDRVTPRGPAIRQQNTNASTVSRPSGAPAPPRWRMQADTASNPITPPRL